MALEHGHDLGWLVICGGVVIGDCGVHGPPDERRDIELGYGLAAPYRGHGYGTELVTAASQWLLKQSGVERVVARQVLATNTPSRRTLQRAGFTLERDDTRTVDYALGADVP